MSEHEPRDLIPPVGEFRIPTPTRAKSYGHADAIALILGRIARDETRAAAA